MRRLFVLAAGTAILATLASQPAGACEDASNMEARELVFTCTGEASAMLRDLIYTAWQASGL
jgi:hypothetical protein